MWRISTKLSTQPQILSTFVGCFWKVSGAEMLTLTAKSSQERVHALKHLFTVSETEKNPKHDDFQEAKIEPKNVFLLVWACDTL